MRMRRGVSGFSTMRVSILRANVAYSVWPLGIARAIGRSVTTRDRSFLTGIRVFCSPNSTARRLEAETLEQSHLSQEGCRVAPQQKGKKGQNNHLSNRGAANYAQSCCAVGILFVASK